MPVQNPIKHCVWKENDNPSTCARNWSIFEKLYLDEKTCW